MITVSNSEKKNIAKFLNIPIDLIDVVWHGVSLDNSNKPSFDYKKVLEKYGVNWRNPYFFHISSYQPKKNIINILRAFKLYKDANSNSTKQLVIGGKQPERIKTYAEKLGLKLRKDVIFTGYISSNDLPILYSHSICFIFPSYHESFGYPIVESMCYGCPVITSNCFSPPEIAENSALFVNPNSPKDIKDKIESLEFDLDKLEMVRNNACGRIHLFSLENFVNKTMEIYKKTIEVKNY
jgi:glycosyltransferase involved in cell wall biosynthesis